MRFGGMRTSRLAWGPVSDVHSSPGGNNEKLRKVRKLWRALLGLGLGLRCAVPRAFSGDSVAISIRKYTHVTTLDPTAGKERFFK